MKFGSRLEERIYSEWQLHYLDYAGLKLLLKKAQDEDTVYSEKDELEFVEKIDKELEKVIPSVETIHALLRVASRTPPFILFFTRHRSTRLRTSSSPT